MVYRQPHNIMLIIKSKVNEYLKNGNPIFVYTVVSNLQDAKEAVKEVESFKSSQGVNYRENEQKEPLYFSQRPITAGAELKLTSKGRFTVFSTESLEDLALNAQVAIENAKNTMLGKLAAAGITQSEFRRAMLQSLAV